MQIVRERKQTIIVELGLAEARELAKQIKNVYPRWAGSIIDELGERLEHQVAQATKDGEAGYGGRA